MAVDIGDAGKVIDAIERDLRVAALRGLHSAALRGLQMIQTAIIPSRTPQPVDRGLYRAGWRALLLSDHAIIENTEPHSVFIEYGVKNIKPGAAMIRAIREWAIRKGIANPADADRAAWRIVRAMQARGHIFGKQGMGILKELIERHLPDIVEQEVAREVGRIGQ